MLQECVGQLWPERKNRSDIATVRGCEWDNTVSLRNVYFSRDRQRVPHMKHMKA